MSQYEQGRDAPKMTLGERIWSIVAWIVVGGVVGGIGLAIFLGLTASEERFDVGDCLQFEDGKYNGEDCGEQRAEYKVYAAKSSPDDCVDVPGTSSTYYEPTPKGGTSFYCIGDKDLDLAKAINGVEPDECVVVNGSAPAEKSSCDAPESRPVLKVLQDVSKLSVDAATTDNEFFPNECVSQGARDTDLTYGWGLEDKGPNPIQETTWDRVLCLGSKA